MGHENPYNVAWTCTPAQWRVWHLHLYNIPGEHWHLHNVSEDSDTCTMSRWTLTPSNYIGGHWHLKSSRWTDTPSNCAVDRYTVKLSRGTRYTVKLSQGTRYTVKLSRWTSTSWNRRGRPWHLEMVTRNIHTLKLSRGTIKWIPSQYRVGYQNRQNMSVDSKTAKMPRWTLKPSKWILRHDKPTKRLVEHLKNLQNVSLDI